MVCFRYAPADLPEVAALGLAFTREGSTMGDAFVTYVRQPGFRWILSFIIFYRFGEAMVTRVHSVVGSSSRWLRLGWRFPFLRGAPRVPFSRRGAGS